MYINDVVADSYSDRYWNQMAVLPYRELLALYLAFKAKGVAYSWSCSLGITYLWTGRKCVVHWYAHNFRFVYTVPHVDERMG